MATTRLIGGPDLRARLASLGDAAPEYAAVWAETTMRRARETTPAPVRRRGSGQWSSKTGTGPRGVRAAVYGAFWWIFVDRGTRAHGPKRANSLAFFPHNTPTTIFAKKVRGVTRRPFITRAAQEALAGAAWSDTVVKLWQRRRLGSHRAFL
jgi:hypothetical protein